MNRTIASNNKNEIPGHDNIISEHFEKQNEYIKKLITSVDNLCFKVEKNYNNIEKLSSKIEINQATLEKEISKIHQNYEILQEINAQVDINQKTLGKQSKTFNRITKQINDLSKLQFDKKSIKNEKSLAITSEIDYLSVPLNNGNINEEIHSKKTRTQSEDLLSTETVHSDQTNLNLGEFFPQDSLNASDKCNQEQSTASSQKKKTNNKFKKQFSIDSVDSVSNLENLFLIKEDINNISDISLSISEPSVSTICEEDFDSKNNLDLQENVQNDISYNFESGNEDDSSSQESLLNDTTM